MPQATRKIGHRQLRGKPLPILLGNLDNTHDIWFKL